MTKKLLFITALPLVWLAAHANPQNQIDAKAAYARLGTLAGEWEADTSMGKIHLTYELIAGGSALVERETTDHMPPMETVYHLDGNRLQLSHYCITPASASSTRSISRPCGSFTKTARVNPSKRRNTREYDRRKQLWLNSCCCFTRMERAPET